MEAKFFRRLRPLKMNPLLRAMVRKTYLTTKNDLIPPLFVIYGEKIKKPVKSMPKVFQMSIDYTVEVCKEIVDLGKSAVILFGFPQKKTRSEPTPILRME